MATDYTLYVRHEVYLRLEDVRGRHRHQILSFFESLERNPAQPGDYETISPEGRAVQVKVVEAFAILFWADHAVCEIKIVDLVSADA